MPSNYDKIRQDNIRRRGDEFDDIGHLISEQLYSDRSHFVYELLQNAEDALDRRFRENSLLKLPCSVKFVLFEDRLEFRHFGQLFNEADVIGVSDVLKGTKQEDVTQIGKFGIGFKSVYAFTATPEIYSGGEHFVIERYIRPKAKEPYLNVAEGETLFVFPFNHKNLSQKDAFALILNKLKTLGPRVLLFLNRINEIEWRVECTGEKGQYLKESKSRGKTRQVTVIGQNNGKDEDENWLIFERPVPVPDGSTKVRVEVGFRLETSSKDEQEGITRIKDSPLVVYFPTEKATMFGFLIQGPYRTTPSRDNIPKADDWNETLVRETAQLLTDVLPYIKELGLLSVSLLEALPIRMDDFPEDSMFYPIFVAVREALMNKDLLPTYDGTFICARNAKLASAEWLRKLLQDEQIRQLFKTENALKWISGEISGEISDGPKHDLWKYIRDELKVEEVTPDSYARKLDDLFLKKQTDEWFVRFYESLSGVEALWRPPRWPGDTAAGLLRAKPILRLQDNDNSQIVPFKSDGATPNAFLPPPEETDFPIVKRLIANDEKVKDFLKRLGLSEPDVFDDIVRRVLPKYTRPDASSISQHDHAVDIQKILRALASDSEAGKKQVVQAARQTPFLKAIDQNGNVAFQKPVDVYFPTQELTDYFFGCPDVWFLSETEGEEKWSMLGVENKPRFKKIMIELSSDERSSLRGNQGYSKDLETIDYELDGVENFLSRFSEEKKPFDKYSLILWNFLLGHLRENSYYRFYEGEYKWFYYQERTATFDATWKKQLRRHEWLLKSGDDVPHLPSELRIVDLPDSFNRDDKLADLLGMKKDDIAILAEKAGIPAEDIEFMKQYPEEIQQLKAAIAARNEKPEFPIKTSTDSERRKKKMIEKYKNAPKKKYEEVSKSTKTTENTIDAKTWLNETYKNGSGELICQICKKEMPFKKRDENYYFEAVEILRDTDREMEELHIALCPLCAAMYNEFVKLDDSTMKDLNHSLKNSEEPEVSLKLGKLDTSIRFVESHRQDIRTILQEKG